MSDHPFPVPGHPAYCCDTPMTQTMIDLMGRGAHHGAVYFSRSQTEALQRFYDFDPQRDIDTVEETLQAAYEKARDEYEDRKALWDSDKRAYKATYGWDATAPRVPRPPTPLIIEKLGRLQHAGAGRNLMRFVERDGLRLMAFLSRYLEQGEDPVKLVAQLCIDAGYDVPDVSDWLEEDND